MKVHLVAALVLGLALSSVSRAEEVQSGPQDKIGGAFIVNPHDVGATARALFAALRLPAGERRTRMRRMRREVALHDVHSWAGSFLTAAGGPRPAAGETGHVRRPPAVPVVPSPRDPAGVPALRPPATAGGRG